MTQKWVAWNYFQFYWKLLVTGGDVSNEMEDILIHYMAKVILIDQAEYLAIEHYQTVRRSK